MKVEVKYKGYICEFFADSPDEAISKTLRILKSLGFTPEMVKRLEAERNV